MLPMVGVTGESGAAWWWMSRRTGWLSAVYSMPHSPRIFAGKLWLLDSGTGQFGFVDMNACRFEPVAFCPGYLRGLSFHGGFAIAALSRPRDNKTFTGLPLDGALAKRGAEAQCALMVIA
jgi:uncharacterized protein (TIGR03032 family)